MARVFATEATGKVGRHVVSGLFERNERVRALARDPSAVRVPDPVEVVSRDLMNRHRYGRGMTSDAPDDLQEPNAAESEPSAPSQPATEMLELSREECLKLLRSHRFGRLAVNVGDSPPVIRPVNYVFDEPSQSVVFRTAVGSKFHALLKSATAAFEIDEIDEGSLTGWSVIIHGVTDEVTNPSDVRRLDALGLKPWAPGEKPHWVHIRSWTVSGRRIVLA